MFWIHGGGYVFGTGHEHFYGPNFLLTEDVVLVTINYRLGIFGFLNFEDPSIGIPGNAGCKDMVMALKWVQKNIASFNGDPSNVTIFGESAGAASIHLLLLSPLSKGLFHKAIAQSGCAINPWLPGTKGVARLASSLDIEHDEHTIYNLLMQKSTEELYEIQTKELDFLLPCLRRPWGLVVETSGEEPFLNMEPIDLINDKLVSDVPVIFGFNSSEGMCFDFAFKLFSKEISIQEMIPWILDYKFGSAENDDLLAKVKRFYYGDQEPCEKNSTIKYNILGDVAFVYGILKTVRHLFNTMKSPLYLYQMSIETELNVFKKMFKIDAPGVSHYDDIGYLFSRADTPEIRAGSIEEVSIRRFVRMWTNFAKCGNPTPTTDNLLNVVWKPVTGINLDYLDIGREILMNDGPLGKRLEFWKEIFASSPTGHKYQ